MRLHKQRMQAILEQLDALSDSLALFDYLVEEAALTGLELNRNLRQGENLIKGCDSLMWVEAFASPEGRLCFRGDSDSMLLCGMLALLEKLYRDMPVPVNAQAGLIILQHPLLNDCFSTKQLDTLRAICRNLEKID